MIDIRIQNDIPLKWSFFTKNEDGERIPYVLEGRDVTVIMTDCFYKQTKVDTVIDGNAAIWTFRGKDQKTLGVYSFTFYENYGENGMKALDKIHPFRLVSMQESVERGTIEGCCSCMEVEPIEMVSEIDRAITYDELPDKPQINHVILVGDKSLAELGIEPKHPYLSLERVRPYLYRATFDKLPEDNGGDSPVAGGGCSAFVQDGKLYRNYDFNYDNAASFIVRTRDFEGMAMITGLEDGQMNDKLIAQLPYRMVDGINNNGIKLSVHLLFNDWEYTGAGDKSIPMTSLPCEILSRVKSMATITTDLAGVLGNLAVTEVMGDYLLQVLVTDGTTTYAVIPPTSDNQSYELVDATSYPKMSNFRYVARAEVSRTDTDLQTRPTGIERFNLMPCDLRALRFTKAYESPAWLSEFIGIDETTKGSTDAELNAIYNLARAEYLQRQRDGKTWQTMHSVVYGDKMESLFIQENWEDNIITPSSGGAEVGYFEIINGVLNIKFEEYGNNN